MNTLKHAELSTEIKQQKKVPTDIELCAYIILAFHSYPSKSYLTTSEFLDYLSSFTIIDKDRLEKVLFEFATAYAITHSKVTDPSKGIKDEKRWNWSIKMAEKDGDIPRHFRGKSSKETEQ